LQYHDQLLEQAFHLANRERTRPRQASLRRAVSTAYYALFHLLIYEATLNWKQKDLRPTLSRHFSHGKMKSASQRQGKDRERATPALSSPDPTAEVQRQLSIVAKTFVETQAYRHTADYDNAESWTRIDTLAVIDNVKAAFESWALIRKDDLAQAYLLSLLGPPRD